MKNYLLIPIIFIGLCYQAFAANPAFTDFFGTNGIIIQTNGNKVQVRAAPFVVTNITGTGNVLVTSNNLGSYDIFGFATNGVTNIVILTNGVALGVPSALNFIYPVTGLLSGATADIGVNSVTTINPTDGYIPFRSNSTTFADSPFYKIANDRVGFVDTNSFLFSDFVNFNLALGGMAMTQVGFTHDTTVLGVNSGTNLSGIANGNTLVGSSVAPSLDTGDNNVGIGLFSLSAATDAADNVAIGVSTLQSVVSGIDNTAVGRSSMDNITGSENTALGRSAGSGMIGDGIRNTFLGAYSDTLASRTNSTAIGYNSIITSNNQVVFGNGVSNYQFRGVNYIYPAAHGAAGTVLTNNGAGTLGWGTVSGTGGGDTIWTNDNSTLKPSPSIGFTNLLNLTPDATALVPTLLFGAADAITLINNSYGTPADYSLASVRITQDGSRSDNNALFITGNQSFGDAFGAVQILTQTNLALIKTEILNAAGDTFSFQAGYDPNQLGSVIRVITNSAVTAFRVDAVGGIDRMKGITQNWPSSQGAAGTVLTNDGSGNLGWGTVSGGGTPEGISRAIQVNSNDTFFASDNFLWDWTNNIMFIKTTAAGDGRIQLSDISAPNATNELNALWMRSLGNNHLGIGNNATNNFVFRSEGHLYPATPGAHDFGAVDNIIRSNVVQHLYASNSFVFFGGTLGAGNVLTDPLGDGSATWGTNVGSLLVTNLTVVNEFKGPVTFQTNVFITNLFLGGVAIRTNQYTTNISGTPVIGSFWFGGTNGAPVTNGPRNSAIEYIPVMRTFRQGDVGAQGAGHDSIDTQSVSNYWNSTNQGFGSVAFGSNNWSWGNYSTIANGMFNIISSNAFGSFIGSGSNNIIHTNAFFSFIGSGDINKIRMNSRASVIVGGTANLITDSDFAFIGGGQGGQITGISDNSTIAGGAVNEIASGSVSSTIGGGDNNDISQSDNATIAGGDDNDIITTSDFGTIGGGSLNDLASAAYGTIAGGQANQMSAARGFIGGGNANFTASDAATIGGGVGNFISVSSGLSSILGGTSNRIEVAGSTAIGNYLTNTTLRNVIEIGNGDAGGNNRKIQIDGTNGLRIRHYGGHAGVGGTYLITNTPIASAGSAETNLQVVTVGAHVLTNNNDRLLVRASGRFAATSNTKQIKLVYGSTTIFDSGAAVANTGAWTLDGEIIRTGNTSQSCNVSFNGGTNVVFVRTSALDAAETNGIATVLKITGTASGNGDITNRSLTVTWMPSP